MAHSLSKQEENRLTALRKHDQILAKKDLMLDNFAGQSIELGLLGYLANTQAPISEQELEQTLSGFQTRWTCQSCWNAPKYPQTALYYTAQCLSKGTLSEKHVVCGMCVRSLKMCPYCRGDFGIENLIMVPYPNWALSLLDEEEGGSDIRPIEYSKRRERYDDRSWRRELELWEEEEYHDEEVAGILAVLDINDEDEIAELATEVDRTADELPASSSTACWEAEESFSTSNSVSLEQEIECALEQRGVHLRIAIKRAGIPLLSPGLECPRDSAAAEEQDGFEIPEDIREAASSPMMMIGGDSVDEPWETTTSVTSEIIELGDQPGGTLEVGQTCSKRDKKKQNIKNRKRASLKPGLPRNAVQSGYHSCRYCPEVFGTDYLRRCHLQDIHRINVKECPVVDCTYEARGPSKLRKHMSGSRCPILQKSDQRARLTCLLCGQRFRTCNATAQHEQKCQVGPVVHKDIKVKVKRVDEK